MVNNVHVSMTRALKRTASETVNDHPLNRELKEALEYEHLLPNEIALQTKRFMTIHNIVISLLGGLSAVIPLVIAFRTVAGI
jgi:hypothetical protein